MQEGQEQEVLETESSPLEATPPSALEGKTGKHPLHLPLITRNISVSPSSTQPSVIDNEWGLGMALALPTAALEPTPAVEEVSAVEPEGEGNNENETASAVEGKSHCE